MKTVVVVHLRLFDAIPAGRQPTAPHRVNIRRANALLRISRHQRPNVGRSDREVHSLGEGAAQPGNVSQILNAVDVAIVVVIVFEIGIIAIHSLLGSSTRRGGLEVASVGPARGRVETVLDRRGLHVLSGRNINDIHGCVCTLRCPSSSHFRQIFLGGGNEGKKANGGGEICTCVMLQEGLGSG